MELNDDSSNATKPVKVTFENEYGDYTLNISNVTMEKDCIELSQMSKAVLKRKKHKGRRKVGSKKRRSRRKIRLGLKVRKSRSKRKKK